jgi:hypothetical protein
VRKTFIGAKPIGIGLAARPLDSSQVDRSNGAGVSNPRARQRALAIGIADGAGHGEPLA